MSLPSPPVAAVAVPSALGPLAAWLGTWSRPPDLPAQIALALAGALFVVALVPTGPRWLGATLDMASLGDATRRHRFLMFMGFVAALLSLGYVAFYLRGGPRSPEAAAYWLQGRAMARGQLTWTVPEPSASFRARDLLFAAPDRVSGIFPPGFATLLAPAFLVGAPMLVGPVLAAGLVLATWLLAYEIAAASGEPQRADMIGRVAAGLSVLSVALRYHTADTLPYGAAALALATVLAFVLRARRTDESRLFGLAGLALGFLVAAQPATALPAGAVVAWGVSTTRSAGARAVASRPTLSLRPLSWALVAALPGALLLLAANRAAVGHALGSPVSAYVRAFEARQALPSVALAGAALQSLRVHLADTANLEPLALLVLVPLWRAPRRAAGLAALVVVLQVLGAAISETVGAAPGPAARMLVPVIPIEHALIALALARAFPQRYARAAFITFGLSLAGFAVHTANDHERLARADTGRPHYEPDVAREGNVAHGLLFFDDDQGFELAYDPGVPASHGIEAARMRGDDHDRLLYDSLGHPAVHRYVDAPAASSASVSLWTPPGAGSDTYRFEAESDWPPVGLPTGSAAVRDVPGSCASEGHVLQLTPPSSGDGSVTLALPVPRGPTPTEPKSWSVVPRILQGNSGGTGMLKVVAFPGGPPLAEWTWQESARTPSCLELDAKAVHLGGGVTRAWLILGARGGTVALDKTTLRH